MLDRHPTQQSSKSRRFSKLLEQFPSASDASGKFSLDIKNQSQSVSFHPPTATVAKASLKTGILV
jgi:hypothetical protein